MYKLFKFITVIDRITNRQARQEYMPPIIRFAGIKSNFP